VCGVRVPTGLRVVATSAGAERVPEEREAVAHPGVARNRETPRAST